MRIVHIITRFICGGADENTLLTCNYQARAGYDVTLIVGKTWAAQMRAGLDSRVQFVVIPSLCQSIAPVSDLVSLAQMYRVLRRLKPSLVHTHTSKAGIIGRVAARLAMVPRIVHGVHILAFTNETFFKRNGYRLLEKLCAHFTDAFIHVSGGMRNECLRYGIGPGSIHVVAESGMDVERFRRGLPPLDAMEILRSPVDSSERPFVILSLAALEFRKGQRRFLAVLRKIVDRHANTVLLLAGEGSERNEILARATELGLAAHVRLLGFRNDPECLLACADVLAVCSEREGLPRAIVQAGIAGVPIVTTALPGVDIVVRDGETGFVVPIDDLAPMQSAIIRLTEEPDLRERMRANLRAADFSAWAVERMTEKIDSVYDHLEYGGAVMRVAATNAL